jgi:hypothetical protein
MTSYFSIIFITFFFFFFFSSAFDISLDRFGRDTLTTENDTFLTFSSKNPQNTKPQKDVKGVKLKKKKTF